MVTRQQNLCYDSGLSFATVRVLGLVHEQVQSQPDNIYVAADHVSALCSHIYDVDFLCRYRIGRHMHNVVFVPLWFKISTDAHRVDQERPRVTE